MLVQTQAISAVNSLLDNATLLLQFYNQQVALNNLVADTSVGSVLTSCATAPLLADGTQSSTEDATPNSAHPIMVAVYPTLKRPLTAAQIIALQTILSSVVSLINGNAVAAQSGARATINTAAGGL